ncbi:PEP-CTERM sorting domain-containing protein [Cerasicoccus frondis]|uniref:PEP-CTERM sorting domain-containing protein n=1 Tax=Cerasicoccus frondis TaxID=490090 RepID=UPI002852787C|nr:PEP-CTERM sorting domain-containing protein [Cerasicoccus frondis]
MKKTPFTALILLTANLSQATLHIAVDQVDAAVLQFSGSGSLDLTGADIVDHSVWNAEVAAAFNESSLGFLATTDSFLALDGMDVYALDGPGGFWPTKTFDSGVATGDDFFLYHSEANSYVGLPAGYQSGDPISFSLTTAGDLSDFDEIEPATEEARALALVEIPTVELFHLATMLYWLTPEDTDSVFLTVGSSVPEPNTFAMMAGVVTFGLAIGLRRRLK